MISIRFGRAKDESPAWKSGLVGITQIAGYYSGRKTCPTLSLFLQQMIAVPPCKGTVPDMHFIYHKLHEALSHFTRPRRAVLAHTAHACARSTWAHYYHQTFCDYLFHCGEPVWNTHRLKPLHRLYTALIQQSACGRYAV